MGTDLNNGYNDQCYDGLGGIDWAAAIETRYIDTLTVDASNQVTAMTLKNGKRAYDFHFEVETAFFDDVKTVNAKNGTRYSAQSMTFVMNNMENATRNRVEQIASSRTTWIVRKANGNYKVLGAHLGLAMTTGTGSSGTVRDDRDGYELNLIQNEKALAYDIPEAIALSLLLPAS